MPNTLLRSFRFQVKLRRSPAIEAGAPPPPAAAGAPLGDGGFQECSGLEVEMDVREYLEGGRNDGVIRRVGRAKYQNLVLKRGMFFTDTQVNREVWIWIQSVV